MSKTFVTFLAVLAVLLVVLSQAFFIVDETEQAFVLQLGQPVGDLRKPGLHVKIPLIQEVKYFDRRILSVDPAPEQVVISSATIAAPKEGEEDQEPGISNVTGEPIILDTFARYEIVDPLQFYKTLFTVSAANSRLESILTDATKAELGKTSLQDLLSAKRTVVMGAILKRVNRNIERDSLGIRIVDVRIVRADLTADLRTSTVRRMISELQERATETRAIGEERALEIRSTAEKERTVILAEAQRDSEIMRGEGDKEAIQIYAAAFNKDKEFYAFMRSMEAYRNTLSDPNTQMILSPSSDFLRYLGNSAGGAATP